MSKKKQYVMEAERKHFVYGNDEPGKECLGCVKNGIPEAVANEIYDRMISFAAYAFNKAHAACYAYVAFQTAFLKCHYPREYMAALLTSVMDKPDKVVVYCEETRRMGIEIAPPDINISETGFTVDGNKIRFGLCAIKNAAKPLNEKIVIERKSGGRFTSLYDFCKRMSGQGINRRVVECFIYGGTFDSFGCARHAMIEDVPRLIKVVSDEKKKILDGQLDMFALVSATSEIQTDSYEIPELREYSRRELLKKEKEVSGVYLSGHPLGEYRERIENSGMIITSQILEDPQSFVGKEVRICGMIVSSKKVYTKANNEAMAFMGIEDLTGKIQAVMFPKQYKRFYNLITENNVVVIDGYVSNSRDSLSLSINTMSDAATYLFRASLQNQKLVQ